MNAVRVPKTGALPECHRHSPGLRRGITGDDRGETGSLPHGECRRFYGIPGLCRDAAGFHRGTTGDNRGYCDYVKKCLRYESSPFANAGRPARTVMIRPGLYRKK
ncbi:hypothetical protein DPMN_097444 [Dreissena polymorpha]|uniref:Uncharacterized protein n=1 Tax=Dreissena polymorpha TaxID=45954 RepID=A0A9D4LB55_DREPO|nr:hypothetical protein DPMN_097444 [Dreissena polymorpha]